MSPRALLLHQALLKLAGGSESFGKRVVAQSSVPLAPGSRRTSVSQLVALQKACCSVPAPQMHK